MRIIACFAFVTFSFVCAGQDSHPISLRSPDGNLHFILTWAQGHATYEVVYKGKKLVYAGGFDPEFEDGKFFGGSLSMRKPIYRDGQENYELIVGKTRQVNARYREVTMVFQQAAPANRIMNIEVRVFNDGLGFRYLFPKQEGWNSFAMTEENTTFHLTGDPLVRTLLLPNYTTSHEGLYSTMPLSEIKEDTLMDTPTLFEFPGSVFLAVTEAALLDYAGMYLSRHNGFITGKLSPMPHQAKVKVIATLPARSPWRVLLISDRVGALVESNIITSLNEPSQLKDIAWIRPGKSTWSWWNGHVVSDSVASPGMNFATARYYIDFCARNGIDYHSVTDYGNHQWYKDDGEGLMPGPHSDVTTPVDELNMKEICDYANSKGVGIRVWVHWAALYPKLDTAFALFEKWGIRGMMVDFMDRDDQEMVNIQTEILQKAAAHHLHIQFHGAYKPTGLNRPYPNEFTREGTLNYEADKWNDQGISPDHDINIPFTRMLAGSTDYHLGGFRAVPKDQFKVQFVKPLVLGTRCHMLGMYVVLENELPLICDYPEAYEGEPGFEFIKDVPSTWDETKVLDAKAGEYIVVARRKEGSWFVGAITNHSTRQLTVPLTFLGNGNYRMDSFTDGPDTRENPNHLNKETKEVTRQGTITLSIASGGGAAASFKSLPARRGH